jgi:methylated-DNA-protein-cysteine methyltransferase-like protein
MRASVHSLLAFGRISISFLNAMNRAGKCERRSAAAAEVLRSVAARLARRRIGIKSRRLKVSEGERMSWDPVYRLIKKIPRGRVTTYGELARKLRLPGGARAVGYAMAACPSGRGIPWHRVVGAGGRLLIPEPHGSLQRRLLEAEGVRTEFGRIDMQRYGWKPRPQRKISRKRNIRRQH